jgi:hypothetical protein
VVVDQLFLRDLKLHRKRLTKMVEAAVVEPVEEMVVTVMAVVEEVVAVEAVAPVMLEAEVVKEIVELSLPIKNILK